MSDWEHSECCGQETAVSEPLSALRTVVLQFTFLLNVFYVTQNKPFFM